MVLQGLDEPQARRGDHAVIIGQRSPIPLSATARSPGTLYNDCLFTNPLAITLTVAHYPTPKPPPLLNTQDPPTLGARASTFAVSKSPGER